MKRHAIAAALGMSETTLTRRYSGHFAPGPKPHTKVPDFLALVEKATGAAGVAYLVAFLRVWAYPHGVPLDNKGDLLPASAPEQVQP